MRIIAINASTTADTTNGIAIELASSTGYLSLVYIILRICQNSQYLQAVAVCGINANAISSYNNSYGSIHNMKLRQDVRLGVIE